ncbi:replication protein [Alishewanella sp. HL-SH06]|uniref:replication protein n=1 Tax=Alishewanella sp. HL-SH06 TaxID=3461144 RepID=UPI004041C8B4
MTATNVIDFNAKRNEAPPVIADIENGYCKLANELLEEICQQDISGSQFQLLLAIVRCTYGYNKKVDRVTNTYLAELTGLGLSAVKSGLQKLEARHIISVQKAGIMKLVAINKTISEWQDSGTKKTAYTRQKAAIAPTERSRNCDHKKPQLHQQEAAIVATKSRNCGHTKDNLNTTYQRQLTKDTGAVAPKHLDYSSWPAKPNDQTLKDWLAYRKSLKAPVNQTIINRLAKQLSLAVSAGMSVDDCLSESMTRGWKGFEYAWLQNSRSAQSTTRQSKPHSFENQHYEPGVL